MKKNIDISALTPPAPSLKLGMKALRTLLQQHTILAALETIHRDMGNIFQIPLPAFAPIVLVGPQANRFTLISHKDDMRWRLEQDPVTRLLRNGLLVVDGSFHDDLRQRMTPALHRTMLTGYIGSMAACVEQITTGWDEGSARDMLIEMRRVALLILVQTLFKVDFAPHLARLWASILRTLTYISPGAWLLWRGIPRPGYKQAIKQVDGYLNQIIRARRAAPGEADDLLGLLVTTPGMSDDVIRDQLLTMLIAGHDTSTALLAWTLYLLGGHPEIMNRLQAEIDTVVGIEPPTYQQLSQLKYLDRVIKESLRLYPPIHAGMREAATDLNFEGYHIPAGARIMYSIYLSHRQPEYWPEPHRFDPERFSPEQHRLRPPHTYVPFGGGPRNCIGAAFGLVEAKVVLARILQQFELKLLPGVVRPHMGATLEPRPGVMMKVHRRRL